MQAALTGLSELKEDMKVGGGRGGLLKGVGRNWSGRD